MAEISYGARQGDPYAGSPTILEKETMMEILIWIATAYFLLGVFVNAWILIPMLAHGEFWDIDWIRLPIALLAWPIFFIVPPLQPPSRHRLVSDKDR